MLDLEVCFQNERFVAKGIYDSGLVPEKTLKQLRDKRSESRYK